MAIQTVFIILGLSLAALAVIVTVVGMRVQSFPSRGTLAALLTLGVLLVGGTATYAVKEARHEAHEREHGEEAQGEEAAVPFVLPARF